MYIIPYRNSSEFYTGSNYLEYNFTELEEIEELLKPYETYWKQQKQEGRKQNA